MEAGAAAAPASDQSWQVVVGSTFTPALDDPPGRTFDRLGARIEIAVTRAIVAPFHEAALADGVWTVTLDTPLEPGAYELVWMTLDDPPSYELMVPLVAVTPSVEATGDFQLIDTTSATGVRPTTDEVAELMRTRTRDENGNDQGTFTAQTWPPVSSVDVLIDRAIPNVLSQLPAQVDPELYSQVRWAIVLTTAILVETSFFRVSSQAGQASRAGGGATPVDTYRQLLNDTMTRLKPTTTRFDGLF